MFVFILADAKCELEEGSEMSEKEMLPVFRPLPVSTGYMAGKMVENYSQIILINHSVRR